jgi:hypothetical protein
MRKANWILATIVLLGTGVVGLINGPSDLPSAGSLLQRSVAIAVIVYGICGLAGGLALALRKRAAIPLAVGWSAGVVWAATIASFAFHDPTFSQGSTVVGVSSTAIATMAICAWMIWSARRTLHAVKLPQGAASGDIPPR